MTNMFASLSRVRFLCVLFVGLAVCCAATSSFACIAAPQPTFASIVKSDVVFLGTVISNAGPPGSAEPPTFGTHELLVDQVWKGDLDSTIVLPDHRFSFSGLQLRTGEQYLIFAERRGTEWSIRYSSSGAASKTVETIAELDRLLPFLDGRSADDAVVALLKEDLRAGSNSEKLAAVKNLRRIPTNDPFPLLSVLEPICRTGTIEEKCEALDAFQYGRQFETDREQATEVVHQLLQAAEPEVRAAAIVAAFRLADPPTTKLEAFRIALDDIDPKVRAAAARAARSRGRGWTGDLLHPLLTLGARLLEDPSSDVRKSAARLMTPAGTVAPELFETIVKAAQDSVEAVRVEAVNATQKYSVEDSEVVSFLTRALDDESEPVRRAAVEQLGSLAGEVRPDRISALGYAAHLPGRGVAPAAASSLGKLLPSTLAQAELVKLLESGSAVVQGTSLRALCGRSASDSLASAAIRFVDSNAPYLYRYIPGRAAQLAKHDRDVRQVLVRMLDSEDPGARGEAARYFGNMKSWGSSALPKLRVLANDPNHAVRDRAKDAIARIERAGVWSADIRY